MGVKNVRLSTRQIRVASGRLLTVRVPISSPALLQSCREAGINFTTLGDVGDTAENRRALYELNKTCSADIPQRGDFYSFEEYLAARIKTPPFDPQGVVLSVTNGVGVGMATTSVHHAKGYAFGEMTGVLASHRGQGISLAMNCSLLASLAHAHCTGCGHSITQTTLPPSP